MTDGKPLLVKLLDALAYTVLLAWLVSWAMYPIAALTGWQYHREWRFSLWRRP